MDRSKDRYLTIRASDEERDMVKALADKDGLTVSDWLRLMIRRFYAESFGAKKSAAKPTSKRGK